jgi:hypothetical protein
LVARDPYSARVRLIGYAGNYWEAFDGDFASRGLDPFDLPFARFLNAIYAYVLRSIQASALGGSMDEAIKNIEMEIAKPLPGSDRVPESAPEDEMAIFMKAQAEIQ